MNTDAFEVLRGRLAEITGHLITKDDPLYVAAVMFHLVNFEAAEATRMRLDEIDKKLEAAIEKGLKDVLTGAVKIKLSEIVAADSKELIAAADAYRQLMRDLTEQYAGSADRIIRERLTRVLIENGATLASHLGDAPETQPGRD